MAPVRESDEALLARVRREGDAASFATFYRRYSELVLAFFARRTGTAEVAADLTMEVFAAALSTAQTGRTELPASASGWLFAIARQKLVDSYRQGRADSEVRTQLRLEPMWLEDEDLRRIDELTDEDQITELLHALPAEQRQAVWSFVVEDRTHVDLATELGCSDLVIRKRVSRALRTMREGLETER